MTAVARIPSESGTECAHLCMRIIGVGYLFPIAAIWAAFDYWKVLFTGTNIEFIVTGVYQVVSIVTVAMLSFTSSFSLGPRIVGGFIGQFCCLAVILGFRWIVMPQDLMLEFLLFIVALCSVATGFLDSALLALCSQYSPMIQQSLQIGIGFGTLVSVLYRDATKLLLPGDVANATSVYFLVALATVLVCLSSYEVLMRLPLSQSVMTSQSASGHDGNGATQGDIEEKLPGEITRPLINKEQGSALAGDNCCKPEHANAGFRAVWNYVWKNQCMVFLNLALTTLGYPGLITSIACRQFVTLRSGHWFQELLLTAFTLADIIGRFLTHKRFGLSHKNIWITVAVRTCLYPILLFCTMSSQSSDLLAFAVVSAFGFLNGYCVSLSLIVMNEIPGMNSEQRKTAGRMSACFVNGGLAIGSILSTALAVVLGIGS